MEYDEDYFIAKFEAIPEDQWCSGAFMVCNLYNGVGASHCALGHCGLGSMRVDEIESNLEAKALLGISQTHMRRLGTECNIITANDSTLVGVIRNGVWINIDNPYGKHPKERSINYIKEAKEARLKEELLEQVEQIANTKNQESWNLMKIIS